ncbi:MAG: hypothetical protein U0L85_03460 [Bacilli bacterium]|nr:hypothetical protein [Bacilli bacterium]
MEKEVNKELEELFYELIVSKIKKEINNVENELKKIINPEYESEYDDYDLREEIKNLPQTQDIRGILRSNNKDLTVIFDEQIKENDTIKQIDENLVDVYKLLYIEENNQQIDISQYLLKKFSEVLEDLNEFHEKNYDNRKIIEENLANISNCLDKISFIEYKGQKKQLGEYFLEIFNNIIFSLDSLKERNLEDSNRNLDSFKKIDKRLLEIKENIEIINKNIDTNYFDLNEFNKTLESKIEALHTDLNKKTNLDDLETLANKLEKDQSNLSKKLRNIIIINIVLVFINCLTLICMILN